MHRTCPLSGVKRTLPVLRYDPFMWGRVIIGAVVIVLVVVWLAAIWIMFADPQVLPWKWL